MSENPRRGKQARNFTTDVPKILDLKSSSEQIFSRKLSLGAPGLVLGAELSGHSKKKLPNRFIMGTTKTSNEFLTQYFKKIGVRLAK